MSGCVAACSQRSDAPAAAAAAAAAPSPAGDISYFHL